MIIVAERAGVARGVRMVQCAIQMRPRSTKPLLLPYDRKGLLPLPSFPRTTKERLKSDRGNQEKTLRFKAQHFNAKKTPREGEKKSKKVRVRPSGDRLKG